MVTIKSWFESTQTAQRRKATLDINLTRISGLTHLAETERSDAKGGPPVVVAVDAEPRSSDLTEPGRKPRFVMKS